MINYYIEALSTYAEDVDNIINLIFVFTGFWFILCEVIFFGFLWKFRYKATAKAQYITGEQKHEKKWISIPHFLVLVCDVFIIIGAVQVWVDVKQTLPPPDATVRVVAQQWAWTFVHPGPDGELDTPDDITTADHLYVEEKKVYHWELVSRDVLHDFSVPVFRLKQDAIPGRVIKGWFEAKGKGTTGTCRTDVDFGCEDPNNCPEAEGKTGCYDIQCAEMCGIGHGIMSARLHIHTAEEHRAWQAQNSKTPLAANQ